MQALNVGAPEVDKFSLHVTLHTPFLDLASQCKVSHKELLVDARATSTVSPASSPLFYRIELHSSRG